LDSLDDYRLMLSEHVDSELLRYLVDKQIGPGDRLPALPQLSEDLGISVGKLREQLELARELGIVSVRPRLGTHRVAFDAYPAFHTVLMFGLATGEATFEQFSILRQTIETNMWHAAVTGLDPADKKHLRDLICSAWNRLRGTPVHIPNGEHRDLHLTLFSRLDNPFVQAILQAYWDAYEATELTRFAEYRYWLDVWTYHERIVDAIERGKFEKGRELLIEHFQLLPTVANHR
jgi:DNA-binding FadR family transcriptional regulator